MKINKKLLFLHLSILLISFNYANSYAQLVDFNTIPKSSLDENLKKAKKNLSTELLAIKSFTDYPLLLKYRGEHQFTVSDSVFGKIPFKLFLPESYKPSHPLPLILLLHGGIGQSKFSDALNTDTLSEMELDPFYKKLCQQGFIILMPYADPQKGFDWAANKFGSNQNFTFNSLRGVLNKIKESVNVNDNKVFVFGHSDGSDGAFAFDVYQPGQFAGFVAYNSMLTVLFTDNFYIKNSVNRPLYIVHSDKDDLRPIEQTRALVKIMDSIKVPVKYKEYYGYNHFDKHLNLDFPYSVNFINSTVRDPFPKTIFWETDDNLYEGCDWLLIKEWDFNAPNATWHKPINTLTYNKLNHTWLNLNYYQLSPSAAINANYKNSVFNIITSRVTKFEILINPEMVDINKEVIVFVNGKRMYAGKVKPDYEFCLNNFLATHDKKAIWISSIKLNSSN